MRLCVIPARGGSKRIPRKNIRPFQRQPMIAWSIAAAKASGCFDRIIVSTDDAEIAAVAVAEGAEAPFVRPPELANDHAGTVPVIQHAIAWQAAHGEAADAVCCLYATAPFVTAQDLREGLGVLAANAALDYVFTCAGHAAHPLRALTYGPGGGVAMFNPLYELTRSQDLPPAFFDAGQFYWGRAAAFLESRSIYSPASRPFIIPRWRAQDIDTTDDWDQAERLFSLLILKESK